MKIQFFHRAMFRIIGPLLFGLMVYLIILLLNNNIGQVYVLFESQEVYICIFLSLLFTESFRLLLLLSHAVIKTKAVLGPIIIQFVLSTAITIVVISTALWAYFTYFVGYPPSSIEYQVFNGAFLFLNIIMNIMHFSLYYSGRENTIRIDVEEQKNKSVELELSDYKRDINPALLYRGLERLIVLVHEDTDKAEELIDGLSSVYRYILGHRQMELVAMDEELNAVNDLLQLLNEVHDGDIYLECDEEDLETTQVVPGTLVGIVEQIARATIITKNAPLSISINCDMDGYIEIKHTLRDRLVNDPLEEKALIDTIQRSYNYFSEKPIVRVRAYDESFYKVPILALEGEILMV